MSFLLDTDICSAQMKGNQVVFNRFVQYGGSLFASMITVAELCLWVSRANAPAKRRSDLADLLKLVNSIDVTMDIAWKFGEIQGHLMDAGTPGPEMDLLIAATALARNMTLVTHNVQDYANVPGLRIVDWLAP